MSIIDILKDYVFNAYFIWFCLGIVITLIAALVQGVMAIYRWMITKH